MFTQPTRPLCLAATSTFEELALLCVEPDGDGPGAASPMPDGGATSVRFDGAGRGRVVIAVSDTLLPAIARNMLGADAAPEPRLQRDALGELANVLCGTLLPALAGPAAAFRLAAPDAIDPAGAAHAGAGERLAAAARFALDEGSAVALLFAADVDPPPPGRS